ncbi:GTP-binding protein [Parabacteroides sp. PF5-9]|uniref:GTP-binding protein n=1 Tax=Parabacteroides sp. PF5-9 TaxID=1742404 RepID=UPI002472F661|nr:GTP-binding protein [Parabacteroides sp. PF5-9]MDH6358494.1 Ni2+-binding GTPase involved in maturation of urease and hydrogenase [Parabacteroides sp. PF5-9]
MKTTKLIIAGGFLGAGKTTFLWQVAQQFMQQGLRVGLITNDQAPELVDSELLALNNLQVAEVSGSCFCCNFNGFTDAIQQIREEVAADVIIAEPVGSCADLSATIMQPLKQYWNREVQVAPLSVLADPVRLEAILNGENGGLHPDAAYIYRKQLEESDIIVINKTDLLHAEELDRLKQQTAKTFPTATLFTVSALSGAGIEAWIKEVTTATEAGKRLVDMDYDIYANGEAVLGWLNGTLVLRGEATDWDAFAKALLADLAYIFDNNQLAVGHVKLIVENGKNYIVGNLTGSADTVSLRGSAGKSEVAKLIVNARVETTPENLDLIVRETLDRMTGEKCTTEVLAWRYLQPGRPQPTHRFTEVV